MKTRPLFETGSGTAKPATDSAEMHPGLEDTSHSEPVVLCDLDLDDITVDDDIQARVSIHHPTVKTYAERMAAGDTFPAVIVFFDGQIHWLADGFHRVLAARTARRQQITVELRQGTRRDALQFAIGANASHGLQRSNADKRRAVRLALQEFPGMSDRAIAVMAKVSAPLIGAVRQELKILTVVPRTGLDGKKRKLRVKVGPPEPESNMEVQPTANRPPGKPTARSTQTEHRTKELAERGHCEGSASETPEPPAQRPGLPYVPQVSICSILISALGLASCYDKSPGRESRRADLEKLIASFGRITTIPPHTPDPARQPPTQSYPT